MSIEEISKKIEKMYYPDFATTPSVSLRIRGEVGSLIKAYARQCCDEALRGLRNEWTLPNNPRTMKNHYPEEIRNED